MKKKLFMLLVLVAVLVLSVVLAACGDNQTSSKLTSGSIDAEGVFEDGVTLSANKLDATDDNYVSVLEKVADKDYDKEKVAVFDISLVNGNAKVQPNGKVKITMPAPFRTDNGYVTYHIKGEAVEELATTLTDGKITFETESFSYFVVAGTTGGSVIEPDPGPIINPDNNFFAYADGFEQGALTANGTAVKKDGYATKLAEGQTVELVATANCGYQMLGWYKNEKASGSNEKYDETTNPATFTYSGADKMYVYARFDAITYTITVDLAGGEFKADESIPATYNVETDTFVLPTPEKGATEFLGWKNADGEIVTEIAKGSTGDIVLTATWKAPAYVRVDKNKNPDDNGEYVLFGSYPQTEVAKNGSSLRTALMDKAGDLPENGKNGKWTSYKYYYAKLLDDGNTETSNEIDFMWYIDVSYNGEQYRGVYFDKYRPVAAKGKSNLLEDGKSEQVICSQTKNRYYVDNVYWFKYEPILWKIVGEADGKARLLCMTAVDCQPYTLVIKRDPTSLEDKERDDPYNLCYNVSPGVPEGTLGTDYEHSTVRDWLNNYFYEKVFDSAQKSIVCDTVVDNVTGDVGKNTTEKVFIPSINEVKDVGSLDRKASDYAKSQGTEMQYGGTYCFSWYLRDTYYVLRFQDKKNLIAYERTRYYQLCSVNGGSVYATKDVPCFTGAEGTSNAIVPSLWMTL